MGVANVLFVLFTDFCMGAITFFFFFLLFFRELDLNMFARWHVHTLHWRCDRNPYSLPRFFSHTLKVSQETRQFLIVKNVFIFTLGMRPHYWVKYNQSNLAVLKLGYHKVSCWFISREVMLFVGYFGALGQSRESIHLSKIARGMIVKYMKRIFVGWRYTSVSWNHRITGFLNNHCIFQSYYPRVSYIHSLVHPLQYHYMTVTPHIA